MQGAGGGGGQHIRFDSDDEDLVDAGGPSGGRAASHGFASTSEAGAAYIPPPTAPRQHLAGGAGAAAPAGAAFQCVSAIRTDFDQQDQCYVLDLVHSPAAGVVAASLSNRRAKLYRFSEAGLEYTGDLAGHTQRITDIRFDLPGEPHLLHTASADGTVRGWDVRSGQQVEGFHAPNRELLTASTNGTLVAAGAGDAVLFWDRRKAQPLASFGDTHAQDVTQVSFHPVHRNMLVSGSEDGLLAVFDTAPGLDEDEGFKAALNIDNSVARFGFYGTEGGRLWCRSGTETFHLWEWAAACTEEAEGGNGALADVGYAREQLTAAAAAAPAGAALAPGVDYLVGCEYSPAANQLWLMAGNNGGAVGFFPIVEPPPATGTSEGRPAPAGPAPSIFAPPQAVLARGHDEVVRAVLWPGASGPVCLSGGEDSRLCIWQLLAPGQGPPVGRGSGSTSSSDSVARRQAHLHKQRRAPY